MAKSGRRKRVKEKEFLAFDAFSDEDARLKMERSRAKDLRQSQWWKRKLAEGVCYYCKGHFPPAELTMDHVIPVSRGGKSVKSNVVPACKACNTEKKHLLPMDWEAEKREDNDD